MFRVPWNGIRWPPSPCRHLPAAPSRCVSSPTNSWGSRGRRLRRDCRLDTVFSFSLSLSLNIYIFIYMYFCIYFCAARANEMSYVPEKKKKKGKRFNIVHLIEGRETSRSSRETNRNGLYGNTLPLAEVFFFFFFIFFRLAILFLSNDKIFL